MKHTIYTKHFCELTTRGYYISCRVVSLTWWKSGRPAIESYDGPRRNFQILPKFFVKNNRMCVLKVETLFETSHFPKKHPGAFSYCSNQGPLQNQPVAQSSEPSWFKVIVTLRCLCVNICLIFNP